MLIKPFLDRVVGIRNMDKYGSYWALGAGTLHTEAVFYVRSMELQSTESGWS